MGRTVYLARHGETAWNRDARWQGHTDVALNDTGRAQARTLSEALRGLRINAVRASDLARARETAEIVAAALGLGPVAVDPALRERAFGCFEGLTRAECEARFPAEWARYRADIRLPPPGGEPHAAVVVRMQHGVRQAALALAAEGDGALVVSHGGAMRALVGAITGQVPPALENGALFRLDLEGDAFGSVARIR
jgi:broad specificity phosphatase PhoE